MTAAELVTTDPTTDLIVFGVFMIAVVLASGLAGWLASLGRED